MSAIAYALALLTFVLAGFGVTVGDSTSELDMVAFGLGFVALGLLLGSAHAVRS